MESKSRKTSKPGSLEKAEAQIQEAEIKLRHRFRRLGFHKDEMKD